MQPLLDDFAWKDPLNHVRQHFWVTAGREVVKRVRKECVPFRRFRPKAALQTMADVHRARLGAGQPPFLHLHVGGLFWSHRCDTWA